MYIRILLFLALFSPAIYAADTPPSDASVEKLLEVAQAHKLLDSTMAQVDQMMQNMMRQATAGQSPSPEVQQMFDKARSEVTAMLKEEMSWEKMEPMYLRIYRKSLNQQEVDGMIQFYQTPAGQAVINKMPLILQNTMAEMTQMMGPMITRMQKMQQDMMAEIKAEKEKKAAPSKVEG